MVEDYHYDIFVSYKREKGERRLITPWILGVLDRIELWLTQELDGQTARVFFDERDVDVGSRWEDKLMFALLRSRCLLPIWSPEYFRSNWCLAEWRSFLARENLTQEPTRRLIIPIKWHDGERFPPEARKFNSSTSLATRARLQGFGPQSELMNSTKNCRRSPRRLPARCGALHLFG